MLNKSSEADSSTFGKKGELAAIYVQLLSCSGNTGEHPREASQSPAENLLQFLLNIVTTYSIKGRHSHIL
jgi:hypothetical protein